MTQATSCGNIFPEIYIDRGDTVDKSATGFQQRRLQIAPGVNNAVQIG